MVERDHVERWVHGYEAAWRTAGTKLLADLFAADATYQTAPFREPYRGLEAIQEIWDSERVGPDEAFEMRSNVIAVDSNTAVVRIEVDYGPPRGRFYEDLWILQFDEDGRCTAFEEWFWLRKEDG